MKARIKNIFLLAALTLGLGLIPAGRATAQIFTNLYSFSNSDGANPYGGLALSGNTLYGTTQYGGTNDNGVVFAASTAGTSLTNLYSFTALDVNYFTNGDGANPQSSLILSGNTLYGTAPSGGTNSIGTVFRINTDGTGFQDLHSFSALDQTYLTNDDGAYPDAGLVLSGNTLYGTAPQGGANGNGTVFRINSDGTGFTNLYNFTGGSGGAGPYAGLAVSGNTLYGTAPYGGTNGSGTVFRINTDGSGFTNLYSFTAPYISGYSPDGTHPYAGLILSGNTLYGTAQAGGTNANGTVFRINTDGTGFQDLYSFSALDQTYLTNDDGAYPYAGLILSSNTLYGTTTWGGFGGVGTVFALLLPSAAPQLSIMFSATNVILTWPANATGYRLQSTSNLVSTAVWSTNSPAPVVVNGQCTVTNPIAGSQMFYRLLLAQ
jgi:uncharacterized repeat protein (TIGR03803 family)